MSSGLQFLRRGAQRVAESKKGSGKGGFYLKWKPPQKPANSPYPVAEPFCFINANYPDPWEPDPTTGQPSLQPAHHFLEHNFRFSPKDFRSLICSGGHDSHAQQPCVGCASSHGRKGTEARDQRAFNIAHLMPYHMIPWVKEVNGQQQVQMKEGSNEPIRIREQCKGRGCEFCQRQEPVQFGAQRILTVGQGHLQAIFSWSDQVGMYCASCLSTVALTQFTCQHCRTVVLDVATSGYSNQQLADFAKTIIRCHACGQNGYPQEVIDCGYDPRGVQKLQQSCGNTRRLTIFDCVFYVQREGTSKDTKMVLLNWSPKWQFPSPDGRNIDELLNDIAPTPLDLPEVFRPLSLDAQAEKLGIPNPFQQHQQPYGAGVVYGQPSQQSPYGNVPPGGGYPQQPQQPQYPQQGQFGGYPQQPQQPQYPQQQPYGQPQQPQFGQQPNPQGNVPQGGFPPYRR